MNNKKNDNLRPNSEDGAPDQQAGLSTAGQSGETASQELNAFLKDLAEKKKRREFQLEMVKEFFEDPLKFGVKADTVPTSTSPEEIKKRILDLEYRRDLLKFVLESTEAELALLDVAESETPANEEQKTENSAHIKDSAQNGESSSEN